MNQYNFDLERARAETPGCAHVIHFNNAGAALMPQPVLDMQIKHLQLEADIGGYEAAWQAEALIENSYQAAARLINAHPHEIAIVENATVAWDMAFHSIPFQPGDRILTAQAAYVSNYLAFLLIGERTGAVIETIPNDEHGQVSVDALAEMMDDHVKLIAITHVPTNGGLINPAADVGRIAREWNCLYLLDACQSVGQLPIDVQEIGCDMLSTTGRKWLRGPRGVGFLYVRKDLTPKLIPPFIDLHSATWTAKDQYEIRADARRFENWENNYAAKIGLGVAIDYALEWGLDNIWNRVHLLASEYRQKLTAIPGVTVRDIGQMQGGIVTFTVDGVSPLDVQMHLAQTRINVNTTDVTSTRLDMELRGLTRIVRSSVHYYNSEAEVDQVCARIAEL